MEKHINSGLSMSKLNNCNRPNSGKLIQVYRCFFKENIQLDGIL